MNLQLAALAQQREYSETLVIQGDKKQIQLALKNIKEIGLSYTFGGKFWEVYQGGDKSKATKILKELFQLNFGDIIAVGIGDSENDEGMLAIVDIPMLVQRPDQRWNKLKVKNLQLVKGGGFGRMG